MNPVRLQRLIRRSQAVALTTNRVYIQPESRQCAYVLPDRRTADSQLLTQPFTGVKMAVCQ